MLVGRSVAPRRPRVVYTRIKSHLGASSERLFSTRGMEPEAPNKGPFKEFSEEPISEGPKPKCPDSSKSRKNSLPSSLTLRSLFAKRIQRQRSGLPCKLRFLKYPHSPNQRTTKILSLLSDHQTWDMDAQKALDALEIKLSWKVVREVIKSLSNVPIAVSFFRWAAQQKDFKHNTKTYSAIARLVGESGDLKLMHSLLQQMHTEGCALTPYFLADIMMAYGSLNMVKEAYLVFKEMNNAGCPPNQFVYNCLISILMRGGYLEGAKKVCNMMWNIGGCQPDTITYNMLIDNHGKSGNILKAQQYCFEMKQRGIRPNEKSYASLIGSLRKDGKIEKACEIFHEIKGKGWLVNRVTYTELIRGLGRAGKVEKALEVFREMEDSRCTFDVVVYNIMLDILVKQRLVTEAWKIFVSMQAKQCFPNVVTYNSLIHGFCMAKRMDEAFRWYDGMKREGIDPDDHTHAILISGFCKLGQWDAAYKFLMEKENDFVVNERVPRIKGDDQAGCCGEGVIMSVAVHNAMLDGFVKAGELEIACAHFRVMEEKGCFPDVFSYSIIIHGLGNAGKAKDASEMYKKMKESGLIPNLVTFNTLINVLGKAGMIFEVHEIVHEMLSLGLKPDIITYTSLLSIVGKDSKGFQKQKVAAVKCRFDHVLGISNINQ